MSEKSLSDEDILRLWHDPSFSGSFRGVRTFQLLLKTDLNISIPEKRLYDILKNDTLFLIHQRPKRNFDRRKYDVNYYGQLVQMDIAYMFPDDESKDRYFLLLIDIFSFKIFAKPLKSKSAESVHEALVKIFKDFKHQIYELQCDKAKEFLSKTLKQFFKQHSTLLALKYGKNKASFAEYGILLVKRKLYLLLRSQLSHNWVHFLPNVVKSLNTTPLKRLGGLTPDSIKDEAGTEFVKEARLRKSLPLPQTLTFEQKQANQKNYKGDLHNNDFVYLDFDEKLFDKSFNVSVYSKVLFILAKSDRKRRSQEAF